MLDTRLDGALQALRSGCVRDMVAVRRLTRSCRGRMYSVGLSLIVSMLFARSEMDKGSGRSRSSRKAEYSRMSEGDRYTQKRVSPSVTARATVCTFDAHLSPSSVMVEVQREFDAILRELSPVASNKYAGTTRCPSDCAWFAVYAAGSSLLRIQLTCRFAYWRVEIFIRSTASLNAFSASEGFILCRFAR